MHNTGALIITCTILGVPYTNYSNGPQNPILILRPLHDAPYETNLALLVLQAVWMSVDLQLLGSEPMGFHRDFGSEHLGLRFRVM